MVAIAGAAAAAIGAGGSILGGMGAQSAATKARRSQEYQFNQALGWDVQQYQMAQERAQPWVSAGQGGITAMSNLAWNALEDSPRWYTRHGLDPNAYRWQSLAPVDPSQYGFTAPATVDPNAYRFDSSRYGFAGPAAVQAGDYRFNADPYTLQATQGFNAPTLDPSQYRYTPTETGTLGQFTFTPPTVTDDPGYQFRLQQGARALDASAAARGGLGSGAAQQALMRYGQDLGSQEYQAAYGRSWQQQQEAYERQRLANMTQEERQRYANQTDYARALQQNQDIYGRGFAADQATWQRLQQAAAQNYQQQFGANQFNANFALGAQQTAWNQAQQANQQQFARDYQVASDYYNRLVQQQQTGFTQGIAANDLAYQRAVAQNALQEQRGLGETQRNWQMDLTMNQMMQDRAWQEYQAELARRQNIFNQFASIAGQGQVSQAGLTSAGMQAGATGAQILQNLGNASAAGFINQANAQTGMYSGIAGAATQGVQNWMVADYMKNLQQQPYAGQMGYNAAGQPTSGTLPTTMAAYNQGGYANTQYVPFESNPSGAVAYRQYPY